jgi:simple sugar transport system ATP-binding protein
MLFPEYTAAENIAMGIEPLKWGIFFDSKRAKAEAAKVIESHHFSIAPDSPVHTLGVGEMQQVEICRLLHRNADIIILDEPSSVLTENETASLFKTLRALAHGGKSLILITHKLREIKLISDRVAVLRQGRLVDIRDTAGIDEHEISRMMIGVTPEFSYGKITNSGTVSIDAGNKPNTEEPVVVFDNVTIRRRGQERPLLDRLSFTVHSGEILGFAGVGGNGLGVLEAALGGFLHPASGTILHRGRDISRLNIRRLRNQGLAYVPADRLRVGSAPEAAVDENMIIDRRHELTRMGFLDRVAIKSFVMDLFRRYNIAGDSGAKQASSLSGGNLQKLILARESDQFRDYIVFSEPSWGLDIAASSVVREEIATLRAKGAAIILISANLDEILTLADRIIVMYRGRAAGEFINMKTSDSGGFGTDESGAGTASIKEKIGACMQGLSPIQGPTPAGAA